MKRIIFIVALVIAVAVLAVMALRFFSGPEDAWLCQNGQWVKHGNPSAPQPTAACGQSGQASGLKIISPQAGASVSTPIKVLGSVNGGGWSGFEGQVGTVVLLDASGEELDRSILSATTDWTSQPTNFEANLNFSVAKEQAATLDFRNENPSGEPERNREYSMSVHLVPAAK